ncbi:MAG: glycosyltransferase family 39 protein [Candidatus Melainabacteria bacterium]
MVDKPLKFTALLHRSRWIILILALGALLRIVRLNLGLPLLLHEDEPIYLQHMLPFGEGDWDPDYFKKPSFFLYSYYGVVALAYRLSSWFHGASWNWPAFEARFYEDPTFMALAGRSLTLVFALVTLWTVYRLGKTLYGHIAGLLAALILAVLTTHVKLSAIVISDIPALCGIVLTAAFALNIVRHGRWKDYLLTGAGMAMTMSYKYNVFTGAFLLSAHLAHTWRMRRSLPALAQSLLSPRLWCAGLLAAGLFFAGSPYSLLNFERFTEHLTFEKNHMLMRNLEDHHRQVIPMASAGKILLKILPQTLGWPLYVTGWLAILSHAWQRLRNTDRLQTLVILSFPLAFLAVVSQFQIVTTKYLLPVVVFWILESAGLIAVLSGLVSNRLRYRQNALVATGLTLLLSWPVLAETGHLLRSQVTPHPQVAARHWLESHAQAPASHPDPACRILAEPESLPVVERWSSEMGKVAACSQTRGSFTELADVPDADFRPNLLMTLQPRWVVARVRNRAHDLPYPQPYYDYLLAHYHLTAWFHPASGIALCSGSVGLRPPLPRSQSLISLKNHLNRLDGDKRGDLLLIFEKSQ